MEIDQLHKELGLADHLPRLVLLEGLWDKIQKLERAARQDPKKYFPQYKTLLKRAIEKLSSQEQVEMTGEQIEAACIAFFAHYDKVRAARNVADHEGARYPPYLEPWCEKHLPKQYAAYTSAMMALNNGPVTRRGFRLLDAAVDEMVEAYASAL